MDDDMEEEEVGESDPRLLFMYSYLSKTMKFKVEKWQKMMSNEDYKVGVGFTALYVGEFIWARESSRLSEALRHSRQGSIATDGSIR